MATSATPTSQPIVVFYFKGFGFVSFLASSDGPKIQCSVSSSLYMCNMQHVIDFTSIICFMLYELQISHHETLGVATIVFSSLRWRVVLCHVQNLAINSTSIIISHIFHGSGNPCAMAATCSCKSYWLPIDHTSTTLFNGDRTVVSEICVHAGLYIYAAYMESADWEAL